MWGKLQYGLSRGLAVGIASLVLAAMLASSVIAQSADLEKTFHEGNLAMRNGQLDVAASDFQNVIAAMPLFAEAHFNLGLVRLQQGRLDDAIGSLKRSLSLKPSLRGANLFLGIAELRENLNWLRALVRTVPVGTSAHDIDVTGHHVALADRQLAWR